MLYILYNISMIKIRLLGKQFKKVATSRINVGTDGGVDCFTVPSYES